MNLVTRLTKIKELKSLSQLGIDIFCLDTPFTAKRIQLFTIEEIEDVANHYNTYLLINKMVHEDDLDKIDDYLKKIKHIPIKGIVINDITVYILAKKHNLDNLIIYQPGTMNTDTFSEEYFNKLNIKGITISREITLEEIMKFGKENIELSLIGHGYLDMFYSKRKLLSNYVIHKGIKTFIPRNNYDLKIQEEIRPNDFYPIFEDSFGTHIFRSKKLISKNEENELNHIIKDFFIERIFMTDSELIDSVKLYKNQITLEEFMEKYQDYDSGFYYKKTEIKKGDLNES